MESGKNFYEEFETMFEREMKDLGHANLVLAGKTGVGKSTLLNSAFRENLAEVGVGRPVTSEMRVYEKDGYPLRLYDTVGLELNPEKQRMTIEGIKNLYKEKEQKENKDELLHGMWYCIAGSSQRMEQEEYEFVNEIAEVMPVVIVLTQVTTKRIAQAFKDCIYRDYPHLRAKNIILTLAQDFDDDGIIKKSFGVDELVEFTASIIPEAAQTAWTNAQKASLKLKKDKAKKVVYTTTVTSFGEGFIPIPFSDCAVLVPTQVAMIAGITTIFGQSVTEIKMRGVVTSLIGTAGATFAGKTIVSGLLKLIPGAGTVIGGTISGVTAATLTMALGNTYIKVMEMIAAGVLNSDEIGNKDNENIFQAMFVDESKKCKHKVKDIISKKEDIVLE